MDLLSIDEYQLRTHIFLVQPYLFYLSASAQKHFSQFGLVSAQNHLNRLGLVSAHSKFNRLDSVTAHYHLNCFNAVLSSNNLNWISSGLIPLEPVHSRFKDVRAKYIVCFRVFGLCRIWFQVTRTSSISFLYY